MNALLHGVVQLNKYASPAILGAYVYVCGTAEQKKQIKKMALNAIGSGVAVGLVVSTGVYLYNKNSESSVFDGTIFIVEKTWRNAVFLLNLSFLYSTYKFISEGIRERIERDLIEAAR